MDFSLRRPVSPGTSPKTLPEIVAAYERVVIIQALKHYGFSRTKTATSLGVRRSYLYHRMRLLRINLAEIPSPPGRPRKRESS